MVVPPPLGSTITAAPTTTESPETTLPVTGSSDRLQDFGIVGALLAQRCAPADALTAGVYLHGLAGDRAARRTGQHGLVASDLVGEIGPTLRELLRAEGESSCHADCS